MKNLITTIIILLSVQILNAQSKEEMVEKTQRETSWVIGEIINQCLTINATAEQWTKLMLRSNPYGIDAFESVGKDIFYYADEVLGTTLQKNCGMFPPSSKFPDCSAQIQENVKGKISVTLNISNVKFNETTQKMAIGSMEAVGGFLDAGGGDLKGVKGGWRPRAKSLAIIINVENNSGAPTVKWSTDGATATVTVHAATEPPRWRDAIAIGLEKGGTTIK